MGGGGDGKVFSLAQVAEHKTPKDCWLVIDGKVYDVTNFLEDHPGGDEVLLGATGKDATDDFEDVGHSSDAKGRMDEYYVGEIDVSTIPISKPMHYEQAHYDQGQGQDKTSTELMLIKLLQFLLPLAILALALAIRFYTKSIQS